MRIHHIREAHFQSGIVCPRCHSRSTKRNGKFSKTSDRQRYLCKNCGRTFTDTTGTPLAYVKKPSYLWTEVARCMREGMSCRKTAQELEIAVSTAFRWRHKILSALRERTDLTAVLHGIVEADETLFPCSYKGSHIKNPDDPYAQREAFRQRFGRYAYKGWVARFHGVATKYLGNYMTWFAYVDTTRAIQKGTWEQTFLAKSCIEMSPETRYNDCACAICGSLIKEGEAAGRLRFQSADPRRQLAEAVCHADCYSTLVNSRTSA